MTTGTRPPHGLALAIITVQILCAPAGARPQGVVLNEIYYDHEGSDEGWEFVELYNGGPSAADISGLRIERIDGSTGAAEAVWTAPEGTLLVPGDILLVAGEHRVADGAHILAGALQNGPDAVRITADGVVLDLVGYGEDLPPGLFEAFPCEDVEAGRSLSRSPDGADSQDNRADLVPAPPTPGWRNFHDIDLALDLGGGSTLCCEGEGLSLIFRLGNEGLDRFAGAVSLELSSSGEPGRPQASSSACIDLMPGESCTVPLRTYLPVSGPVRVTLDSVLDENPRNDTVGVDVRLSPGDVLVNEVMYRPDGGGEWVELFNRGDLEIDLSGWSLSDRRGTSCSFPDGTTIASRGYVLAAEDPSAMALLEAPGCLVTGTIGGWPRLNDGDGRGTGDVIVLTCMDGVVSERVSYPSMPDLERGRSVERISDVICSNSGGSIWLRCQDPSGSTPGGPNSVSVAVPFPRSGTASPNPFAPCGGEATRISAPVRAGEVSARGSIWDLDGRTVRRLPCESGGAPVYTALWDGKEEDGRPVRSGLYICVVEFVTKGGRVCRREKICIAAGCGD
mgnify:CR=1 FL=1